MKKLFSLLLALCLLLSLAACGAAPVETAPQTTATEAPTETTVPAPITPQSSIDALQGKKILFVGNSYTYYGRVVTPQGGILSQAERDDNRAMFYYLCQEKGIDVSVTNWTFGAHTLADLFTTCVANRGCDGVHHADYLTDRSFDYVVLQQAGNPRAATLSAEEFLQQCDDVIAFFKAANPNAQFLFLVHHFAHQNSFGWLEALPRLAERGVKVVDWGKLVWELIGTSPFDKNSFIVCRSEKDGFHPNPLTGYLTALMTYCAITGQSAVGQPCSFCGNTELEPRYSFPDYMARHYTYGQCHTNFPEIFTSKETMTALQKLADQYLAK